MTKLYGVASTIDGQRSLTVAYKKRYLRYANVEEKGCIDVTDTDTKRDVIEKFGENPDECKIYTV